MKYLNHNLLSRLGNLPLEARHSMTGNVSGRHRSASRGSSVEFAEYRKYVAGDDTRRLDWKAYARSDRYYIKEFEADTNLRAYIVMDLSGSMNYHPEQVETYDELSPFLQRIAAQNREIDARMAEIRKQQQEFSMITENMSEGLFVVDRNYQILSYNKSAMQIFGMDPRQEHENLLAVNRSEGFRNAVDSALKGRHTQENLELNGRVYQIIALSLIHI